MNKLISIPDERYVVLSMRDEASAKLNNNNESYNIMESIGWP